MRSASAIVTPELLIWARKSSGYTKETIAEKMKISIEKLSSWEAGILNPTIIQLRKLANYYKRSIAVFYLPAPPKQAKDPHDFRRIEIKNLFKEEVQLRREIRKSLFNREIALELFDNIGQIPREIELQFSLDDNPEDIGIKIRDYLGINHEKQFRWNEKYEALNNWRIAVESKDVLVFQTSGISTDEMRGFAIQKKPLPIIGLNNKDHPYARIFTLIHELTHLGLNQDGVCDIYESPQYHRDGSDEKVEVFCNHVAGATLVPLKFLLFNENVSNKPNGFEQWQPEELYKLSSQFSVSQEVILRRLLISGKTTNRFYKTKRKEFSDERTHFVKNKKRDVQIPVYRKVLAHNGLTFVNLVLDNYHRGNITSRDLSDYLSTRLKHLPKIEEAAIHARIKYGASF